MFSPGIFQIILNRRASTAAPICVPDLADPVHAPWQALVREGQVVEAIKQVRAATGLDLPGAVGLVNEYRTAAGLMPPKRAWWRRLFS